MEDEYQEFEKEARAIKKDLKAVLIQNGIILLLLIALHFINQSTGFLSF